jgi:hypothetical protein
LTINELMGKLNAPIQHENENTILSVFFLFSSREKICRYVAYEIEKREQKKCFLAEKIREENW